MLKSAACTAKALRERGYRATPQRMAICEALRRANSHPTVAEIHEYVRRRDPTISLATVYNTLQILTEIGLAREICFRDGPTRYDSNADEHINLVCTRCGSIEDYDASALREISLMIERDTGFIVTEQRFEVYGLCSRCREHRGSNVR